MPTTPPPSLANPTKPARAEESTADTQCRENEAARPIQPPDTHADRDPGADAEDGRNPLDDPHIGDVLADPNTNGARRG